MWKCENIRCNSKGGTRGYDPATTRASCGKWTGISTLSHNASFRRRPTLHRLQYPGRETHGPFATRGKQSKWLFLEQLPPPVTSHDHTSRPALTCPFHSATSGLVCSSPAQGGKARGIHRPSGRFVLLFFSLCFFHHLPHATLNLLNHPVLLQYPSPHLSWNSFLLLTTDVNFSPCSSYTCSRQNCWMTWRKNKNQNKNLSFLMARVHSWGRADPRLPSTCPLLTGVRWEGDANGRSNRRSPRH